VRGKLGWACVVVISLWNPSPEGEEFGPSEGKRTALELLVKAGRKRKNKKFREVFTPIGSRGLVL